MTKGKLYLIPTIIADETQSDVIGERIRTILPGIQTFLVENVRTARRFLSSLKVFPSIEPLKFFVLDKDTKVESLGEMFECVDEGHSIGVLSESGCPGVADPGALAVEYAHRHDITVVPLVGPSSLLLALMASGLNGQRFAFNGYLPIEQKDRANAIREFERESRAKRQTQLFIETPYRNNQLLTALVNTLSESTRLTVAIDLTGKEEWIKTLPVKKWRSMKVELGKTPAVFLFLA
jgi:16S rRNA (cytidine1402-2'-O)-methyltransferase